MTGRRLYDAITDAWANHQQTWSVGDAKVLKPTPPAWAFLHPHERRALNEAARTLTPKRRSS